MKAITTKLTTRAACGLLVIAQVIATHIANAALNSIDLVPGTGDGLITRDTASGLDWLDHTRTLGLSFNDVSSRLGVGGEFQGFHFATLSEVNTLYTNAGLPADRLFTPSLYEPALSFITLVGGTVNSPSNAFVTGIINLKFGDSYQTKGVSARLQFGELMGSTGTSCCESPDQPIPTISSWLARPVPEPTTCALLGLGGLVIVCYVARRRRGSH